MGWEISKISDWVPMTRNTWFRTEGSNSCGSISDRTMGHLLSQWIDGLINGSMTQQISAFVSIGRRATGALFFCTHTHTHHDPRGYFTTRSFRNPNLVYNQNCIFKLDGKTHSFCNPKCPQHVLNNLKELESDWDAFFWQNRGAVSFPIVKWMVFGLTWIFLVV